MNQEPGHPDNPVFAGPETKLPLDERIALELGLKTSASRAVIRVMLENAILFDRKQQDYGPKNITSFGSFGILVRMNDKMERLKSLMGKKRRKPQNESIRDSFKDIANYALMAVVLEKGEWPNE